MDKNCVKKIGLKIKRFSNGNEIVLDWRDKNVRFAWNEKIMFFLGFNDGKISKINISYGLEKF